MNRLSQAEVEKVFLQCKVSCWYWWCILIMWAFPSGSVVKNLLAVQETQIRSLGQEDPLEEEMATQSSILAWEISWTEEPGGLQSMGLQKSQTQLSNWACMHTKEAILSSQTKIFKLSIYFKNKTSDVFKQEINTN